MCERNNKCINKCINRHTNKIPEYLEYLGHKYKYIANKGGLLCYTYYPKFYDNASGSTIIIEHRKDKRLVDQFYVMFHIVGFNGYNDGYTGVSNLKGMTRQAKPVKI